MSSRTARPETRCKLCGGVALLLGVVDFHKSCAEARGVRLPLSGTPVYYHRCPACGFAFTEAFDDWPDGEFRARIYNADYGVVDPDYAEARPDSCAAMVVRAFGGEARKGLRVLDYGGGNGRLAARLCAAGFDGVSWDPLSDGRAARPDGRFGLITCFEVLEHAPDPHAAAAEIAGLLAPGGMVLFSTLVQPAEFGALGVGWWYVGPRNGHVSIFSGEALRRLWAARGMALHSFGPGVHAAYAAGAAPAVGRHLLPREAQSASA